ncbi:uncharacterized protein LOC129604917 [Betta splendens]|uniref:Uncharacterized protein LOC129604917 n=1 Tax=Betta splendens TaxID=158456 RepID=A0A9W2Y683_BETSP|nr:uncharacterized protein LOC129604917 [Betta splendens]
MGLCLTKLEVSLTKVDEQQLIAENFIKLSANLGKSGKNEIFLWYKLEQVSTSAISRIQFSYNDNMAQGLIDAGFSKIEKSLNEGASGDSIYLWYYVGPCSTECPIMEIDLTTGIKSEVAKCLAGWEKMSCNLNSGESYIHLWGKRFAQMYVSAITVTTTFEEHADLFKKNYNRVDKANNQNSVFIWYQLTNDEEDALRDLKVSVNKDEYRSYQAQGYTVVNKDLNVANEDNTINLWYKKDGPENPIKTVFVLTNKAAVEAFKEIGVNVIEKNLTGGKEGAIEYLYFTN